MLPNKSKLLLNRRRQENLPERVIDAIRVQQNDSERLVGWFQLAVVILFGFLYIASPKAFSAGTPFEPVPWVLSVYLVLTIFRLTLSYRRSLSIPLLYVSVIIDMGLLLGMIWTFHMQYQQPASFYLKSPTLLYVFIFIALRALRFEVRYVIAAGFIAAVGWILLAAYAIFMAGGFDRINRDYVYYMTANSILIGAELDKVVTIITVTAILAVAIYRARRLLVRAVAESTAAQDLSRFFAPEKISAKLEKHTKKEGVRALCTAVTYRIATAQGYQPPSNRALLENRVVEGLAAPVDIVVVGK